VHREQLRGWACRAWKANGLRRLNLKYTSAMKLSAFRARPNRMAIFSNNVSPGITRLERFTSSDNITMNATLPCVGLKG